MDKLIEQIFPRVEPIKGCFRPRDFRRYMEPLEQLSKAHGGSELQKQRELTSYRLEAHYDYGSHILSHEVNFDADDFGTQFFSTRVVVRQPVGLDINLSQALISFYRIGPHMQNSKGFKDPYYNGKFYLEYPNQKDPHLENKTNEFLKYVYTENDVDIHTVATQYQNYGKRVIISLTGDWNTLKLRGRSKNGHSGLTNYGFEGKDMHFVLGHTDYLLKQK